MVDDRLIFLVRRLLSSWWSTNDSLSGPGLVLYSGDAVSHALILPYHPIPTVSTSGTFLLTFSTSENFV